MMHFGIDYGSKLAGTTVITYEIDKVIHQVQSGKKSDADKMIVSLSEQLKPERVFIDAPLSLPKAYFGDGDDYFYREVDRLLGAMSPMFLGGLTARAMKVKSTLMVNEIEVFETYPGAFIRSNPVFSEIYTKKDAKCIPQLLESLGHHLQGYTLLEQPYNMHKLDSLIAWISGCKYQNGEATVLGNPKEGVIVY